MENSKLILLSEIKLISIDFISLRSRKTKIGRTYWD